MSGAVDDLNLRLAGIQDALLALPAGPSPERFALLTQRDQLRALAADQRPDEGRTVAELVAELDSLKRQRRQIVRDGTGFATGKGGNNQGAVAGAWVTLGVQARSSPGLFWINARISRIEDLLATSSEPEPQ